MKTSLSALSIGLVMLAGTGISQAADVAQTNTQSKVTPESIAVADTRIADAKMPKIGGSQTHGPVALTDDQMDGITAGHGTGWVHYGYYFHFLTGEFSLGSHY